MSIAVYPFWGAGEPGSGGGSADARPVALDGPLSLYVGQSAQWQITDYDAFSEYLIQVDAGVASLDGDTIDYTAPPSAGEATLTITVNGVARALAIEVRPAVVMAPAITAPLDGAIEIGETPTITTAAFSVVGAADTHIASRYRVWSADGQTLIYDSGPTADLVQHIRASQGWRVSPQDGCVAQRSRGRQGSSPSVRPVHHSSVASLLGSAR